jgi:hypothetical protein
MEIPFSIQCFDIQEFSALETKAPPAPVTVLETPFLSLAVS